MTSEHLGASVKKLESADAAIPEQETSSLARELSRAYSQMAAFYRDRLQLIGPDADTRTRGLDHTEQEAADDRTRIRERPADQVSWFDLSRLIERNPEEMVAAWSHIKVEARRELASGHRTAQALDWNGRPWQRARFLAIRDSFHASTPPQNGIESALLDTAAESFGDYLEWSEHHHMQVSSEVESERQLLERDGHWTPVRLSMAEAIEQSSRMAERAHTRFLRTIKILHDLRRLAPTVYVGNAGQVNIGSQQVNVAPQTQPVRDDAEHLSKSLDN